MKNTETKLRSIRGLHKAYLEGKANPVDITEEYLERAEANTLGCYLTTVREQALEAAREAEKTLKTEGPKALETRPLLGIPCGVKDNMLTQSIETTAASKILKGYIPLTDATAVSRLKQGGAVILGKLNMDEFAMGGSNENSAFYPVDHPTHTGYVPGGSSGGSAAAVRSGQAVFTLGTDTGGSIRLPASFCDIVGLKPSYGRVSRSGLIAFASSLDQIGPLTVNVEDAAIVHDVISGHDKRDATMAALPPTAFGYNLQGTLKGLKMGIPRGFLSNALQPEVHEALLKAKDFYASQGVTFHEIDLPHAQYAVEIYYIVAVSEASGNLSRFDGIRFGTRPLGSFASMDEYYAAARALFGQEVKRRIMLGTFALSAGHQEAFYKKACQVRRKLRDDFLKAFQEVDCLLSPVAPTTPYKRGEKCDDPLQMYLFDLFTIPANLAGLPAISVPCGYDQTGLPIGMQLLAPPFQELKLLQTAQAWFTHLEGVSGHERTI
jgi:aspartyl-tRNA(Asn)/glutamyl-tRNA(Gln) amidotransferase subunit A